MKHTADTTPPPSVANQEPEAHGLVTQEELAHFQDIALAEYGVRLSEPQAYAQATALLSLFETLLKKGIAFGSQNDMITAA